MANKKPQPMTNKEKQHRKELRERLREEGIIPPVKKPLNRKQFAKDTLAEYRAEMQDLTGLVYLNEAISWMLAGVGVSKCPVTSEEVGALKLMKIAIEIKRFCTDLQRKGISTYSQVELLETAVKPILKL